MKRTVSSEVLEWLHGLSRLGCVFLEMAFVVGKGGAVVKRPRRALEHYSGMVGERGVVQAIRWLERGVPIGIMPKSPLWILDADTPSKREQVVNWLMDRGITPLMVSTLRGAHFYFLLPPGFPLDGLKNHFHVTDMDFKFGPKTVLVAPGTIYMERCYWPASCWKTPIVLDPRELLENGQFWKPLDSRPFLVCQRSEVDRLRGGEAFATSPRTPVSVCFWGGNRTLA